MTMNPFKVWGAETKTIPVGNRRGMMRVAASPPAIGEPAWLLIDNISLSRRFRASLSYLCQLVMSLIALQLPDRQLNAVQLAEVVHEATLNRREFRNCLHGLSVSHTLSLCFCASFVASYPHKWTLICRFTSYKRPRKMNLVSWTAYFYAGLQPNFETAVCWAGGKKLNRIGLCLHHNFSKNFSKLLVFKL